MSRRAIPALVVLLAGAAALVVQARETPETTQAVFSITGDAWMPSVTAPGALTESWFCPGLPATADEGVGGEVVISNRTGELMGGRFTILTQDGVVAGQDFEVAEWSQSRVDVGTFVTALFVSVVVEIEGGGALVEQRAIHPAGDTVAACSGDTSTEWYLADGFSLDGSTESLILSNPFEESVVADMRFSTEAGERSPAAFQGFTIPPQSVKVVDLGTLARDEPIIATAISATAGRLVVGRAQHYLGGGRLGYDISLAAPALRDQFWFADGEQGEGITEQFSIYNPTDDDVLVDVVFLGLPPDANFGNAPQVEIPARDVVIFDPGDVDSGADVPDGRHATVFSTLAEPAIVVERIISRPAGDLVATEVLLGAPPRSDGYVATQWHLGIGPAAPTDDALVIYNLDQSEATLTVWAVGSGGPAAVPSLTDIPIGPGAVTTIDLVANAVLGRELILSSTNRMFVERSLPRGADTPGRSASWALPARAPL